MKPAQRTGCGRGACPRHGGCDAACGLERVDCHGRGQHLGQLNGIRTVVVGVDHGRVQDSIYVAHACMMEHHMNEKRPL